MIKLKNVNFSYAQGQKKNGLSDINLIIKKGEVVLLCGESGCGKTTLTRLINGLIPNYYDGEITGEVYINDNNVSALPLYETGKTVGSVFQNPRSQFFNVDTTSELAFGCENKGLPVQEIEKRMNDTISDFKINNLMHRSIFQLSGGEKQKIACASVSACQPDIFVLDEPSSNLDITAIDDLRKGIEVWKSQGKTIVIAEHRLHFLSELADRIIYMKNGKIEKEFTPEQMKNLSEKELINMGLRPICLQNHYNKKQIRCDFRDKIELSNFSFSFKKHCPILDIPSLSVCNGSAVAIIGHNGAGKTTFARCLCGLEKKCKGILNSNQKCYKSKDRLKNCYMVMQDVNHQLFTESVLDEVLLSMKDQNNDKAEEILRKLDLIHMKDLHPMSLSGGQKQRVAIAGAVASERNIIFFDEPTSGLDYRHMQEVASCLKSLQELGKTLFIISHDLDLILNSCTSVIHLEKGKVIDNYHLDEVGQNKLIRFFKSY